MFLHSHVFYCWSCGLQNLCIIASMDPGTSPKHDGEHANYYIYCPTYTHIPEISFPKPRTQFFMTYLHKTFLRASPRGGDGSQVITVFFGIDARPGFHSNERPYPALRSLCFVLVQILLRNIVCGSAFNLYFIIHFNHLVFRNFPRKQIQNSP